MSVTQEDAVASLRLADEAEKRSRVLRGYQSAAPHLIVWGCVYAATYMFSYFYPRQSGLAWLIVVPLALAGDMVIAWRDRAGRTGWTMVPVLIIAFVAFVIATGAIMRPRDPRQMGAFVPLAVAWAYIAMGTRLGHRIMWLGIALGALTLFGFFALQAWFLLWMAAVGGGTLVISGLWMRRA
jgi:hypothetical protein